MSYRATSMVPGDWHPNDFQIGDRFYLDLGMDTDPMPFTITGGNRLYYGDLQLTVDWDDPKLTGDIFPNLQWIGFVDEGDDE